MTSRPKRNRPSYAKNFQPFFSDEEEIVTNVVGESDSEAGSVFNPTVGAEGRYQAESPSDEEVDDPGSTSRVRGDKSAAAINAATLTPGTQNLLSVLRPHRPGISVAPNLPSKDHRHRPSGLWAPPSDVYRLLSPPNPLSKSEVVRTNSADHPVVMQRVKKAWANSSGIGPVWELLEDRAFFKEEWTNYDPSSRRGRKPRPAIFPTVRAQQPQILSRRCVRFSVASFSGSQSPTCNRDASRYLPHDEHGGSTVKVSVGLVESQSRHLCLFDSLVLGKLNQAQFP
jgi:transcription factor C subunit 6